MKRIAVREFGGPEVLRIEDADAPRPGAGEVLVRIAAAGVNPYETYQRAGTYGARNPKLPFTPGSDAAGTVEAIGADVAGLKPGDRVYTYGTLTGSYTELALCKREQVFKLPESATFAQGAAIYVPYVTAYRALFQFARAKPMETVLVHGASGGTGSAAVQLAHSAGLTVIATAGTREGLELVKRNGADFSLNHHSTDYRRAILDAANGKGVDIVLEMLADVNLGHDLELLAHGGRIIVIGSRGNVEITPRTLMARDASIVGMMLWNTPTEELEAAKTAVHDRFTCGAIRPVIRQEIPLASAPDAHRLVMKSGAYGKIVLVP